MDAPVALHSKSRGDDVGVRKRRARGAHGTVLAAHDVRVQVVLRGAPGHLWHARPQPVWWTLLAGPSSVLYTALSDALPPLVDRRWRCVRVGLFLRDRGSVSEAHRTDRIACPTVLVRPSLTPSDPRPFVAKGGRGEGHSHDAVSTPSASAALDLRTVDARLVSQHRSCVNAPARQQLRVGSSALMGRRFLPPLIAVPVVMGEEPWRERPRLRASNLAPRAARGRSRHGFWWSVCLRKMAGGLWCGCRSLTRAECGASTRRRF